MVNCHCSPLLETHIEKIFKEKVFEKSFMAGYIGPKDKISRRLGVNIWGQAKKNAVTERKTTNRMNKKKSEFALQLEEKRKLRFFYGGIREKQFRRYYKKAKVLGGNVGKSFLELLERRLDTVIYRLNLAPTIFSARQIVSHGHVLVNGKKVNVPSYLVEQNDEIEIKEKSKKLALILSHVKEPERKLPTYLNMDSEKLNGKYERKPEREEISYPFELNESLIIEFYSK